MNPIRLRLWKPASWPSASSHATAGIASSDSRNRYQGGNAKLGHYLKIAAGFRKRFRSEYRAVIEHGSERKAEAKQADRETGRGNLKIRTLTAAKRGRFSADRQSVQSRFVDHPKSAVTEADELVSSLMQARGYPLTDFDQRAADISGGGAAIGLGTVLLIVLVCFMLGLFR